MDRREAERGFHQLVGRLDYPMLVATTRAEGELGGCLVGFSTQCSIEPPLFLVCLSEKNRTFRLARAAEALAVHFLPASAPHLAELFGGETGDEVDKFARCEWREGPRGLPILSDCDNWFAGEILSRLPLGDHVGFVLAPFAAHCGTSLDEFTFHRARRIEPGHEA